MISNKPLNNLIDSNTLYIYVTLKTIPQSFSVTTKNTKNVNLKIPDLKNCMSTL